MKPRTWLLLSVLASGITWLYTARVLGPWEHYVNVEHGNLKNQMGDLYSPWMGTRELLLHGSNPYGPEVSHEIQMAFYGHAIDQKYAEPGANVINEQRFAYPVYVVFLLAPTVYADFQKLQVWAAAILALLTALSVLLWMDVLRWRPPKTLIAALVLFTLSTPQVMQGLRLRQLGLVVAFLLAVSAWCVIRNHLALAGIALALSTIKPQMVVLPLAWFLLWGMSAWPRRWPLLAGFGITLATLVGSRRAAATRMASPFPRRTRSLSKVCCNAFDSIHGTWQLVWLSGIRNHCGGPAGTRLAKSPGRHCRIHSRTRRISPRRGSGSAFNVSLQSGPVAPPRDDDRPGLASSASRRPPPARRRCCLALDHALCVAVTSSSLGFTEPPSPVALSPNPARPHPSFTALGDQLEQVHKLARSGSRFAPPLSLD